ncbi:unnamed protein product [Amaranthus hypochondriacus]
MTIPMHLIALANNILLLLLASILIKSPCLPLLKAQNSISNDVFSIDLIHRYSRHSPYYKPSMTLQERLKLSRSHIHKKRQHASLTSNLIPNGADYLIKLAVGNPPVEFLANADTGSDLIWLQCSQCTKYNCIPQKFPKFNPDKSSTFKKIPCNSTFCYYPDIYSGCLSANTDGHLNKCFYVTQYGDATNSTGLLAKDTLRFPSTRHISLQHSIIGCGIQNYGFFGEFGEGIVGLGVGPLSLVSQLGSKINYKFSYCLVHLDSHRTSKLIFGAHVTGSKVVSTPFTTKKDYPSHYLLTLNSITIGNTTTHVGRSDVVLDSGSTLTYLPTNLYNEVKKNIKRSIGLDPIIPTPFENLDLCYKKDTTTSTGSGLIFNPPNLVLHFKGADVVLKAENTFWSDDKYTCMAILPADDDMPIIGNIAQLNHEVGYDLKANMISFSPKDCSKH